jgi:hypothetical protein
VSFSMVGKKWDHVSYCWFFGLPNPRDYKITNWNWKVFFFSMHIYKPKEMSFTIKWLIEFDYCDLIINCKLSSNLVEMIKKDLNFEEEFEGSFEWE